MKQIVIYKYDPQEDDLLKLKAVGNVDYINKLSELDSNASIIVTESVSDIDSIVSSKCISNGNLRIVVLPVGLDNNEKMYDKLGDFGIGVLIHPIDFELCSIIEGFWDDPFLYTKRFANKLPLEFALASGNPS